MGQEQSVRTLGIPDRVRCQEPASERLAASAVTRRWDDLPGVLWETVQTVRCGRAITRRCCVRNSLAPSRSSRRSHILPQTRDRFTECLTPIYMTGRGTRSISGLARIWAFWPAIAKRIEEPRRALTGGSGRARSFRCHWSERVVSTTVFAASPPQVIGSAQDSLVVT